MMHHWLNIGHQKMKISKIENDGICPCCGTAHEDQDHLFKCTNEDARLTMKRAIKEMNEVFIKERLPPGVRLAFMEQVCKATNTQDTPITYQCESARRASDHQDRLGAGAILRGHHHVEWVEAIFKTYKPRVYPPNTPKKNKRKDKSALELSAILVRECWKLFEKVWQTRNDKVHDPKGVHSVVKNVRLTEELIRYRTNAATLLHFSDHKHVDYPNETLNSWTRSRKEKMLKLLTGWNKQFVIEQRTKPKGQKSLTDFSDTQSHETQAQTHPCAQKTTQRKMLAELTPLTNWSMQPTTKPCLNNTWNRPFAQLIAPRTTPPTTNPPSLERQSHNTHHSGNAP